METSRYYREGYSHGRKYYAPDYRVFNGSHRVIRTMTACERAEYDVGYKAGKSTVDANRLISLGYNND